MINSKTPIDMILFCPVCGKQHIDEITPEWSNPPHRSHECQFCKFIWRPADVATNGVAKINTVGSNDSVMPESAVEIFYKLRHKPTGLFYIPCKNSYSTKSNFSKSGKTYNRKPNIKHLGNVLYSGKQDRTKARKEGYDYDGNLLLPVLPQEWEIIEFTTTVTNTYGF